GAIGSAPAEAEQEEPATRRGGRLVAERPAEVGERATDGAPPRRATRARPEPAGAAAPAAVDVAQPDDPHRRARRVADRFNASEARRTVAGLIRSLGEPQASLRAGAKGKPSTVTVAWEISWYQWEIDPGEHGAVREVGKGKEI